MLNVRYKHFKHLYLKLFMFELFASFLFVDSSAWNSILWTNSKNKVSQTDCDGLKKSIFNSLIFSSMSFSMQDTFCPHNQKGRNIIFNVFHINLYSFGTRKTPWENYVKEATKFPWNSTDLIFFLSKIFSCGKCP